MKLYIISNRLPVKIVNYKKNIRFLPSEGGLATGLSSLETTLEKHWIGWPGMYVEREEEKKAVASQMEELKLHPVFLTQEQILNYYEGYSNSTLWPLCHYFYAYTLCKNSYWQAYKEVNRLFYEQVCRLAGPDDLIWVQDYHLMLLPGLLRQSSGKSRIGYFHHIPFPSYEMFRILPERAELIQGLLGSDFIAFHTYNYVRHFINTAEHIMHIDFKLNEALLPDRVVRVNALPMGINYNTYREACLKPDIKPVIKNALRLFGRQKLIISVDRLDYSKGILHRLSGFEAFLERHPEYRGKVTLAMIIVPSRDRVGSYAELKVKIENEVASINGRFSVMGWVPIIYYYHSFSFEELVTMYHIADIALVTSLRDGMNLVAKEYVAAKGERPGVLILSEMAGAAEELTQAIRINPNSVEQIEKALCEALEMPVPEQKKRLAAMQSVLSNHTVNKWASSFIKELTDVYRKNKDIKKKRLTSKSVEVIKEKYDKASSRLLLLDYDGTLVPIKSRPEDAAPEKEVLDILRELCQDPANRVVIISGRRYQDLEKWLGKLPVSMSAEHGAFYKESGVWHNRNKNMRWSLRLLSILNSFVEKTPRSRLEIKHTSLAWHYREVDAWLASERVKQLIRAATDLCKRYNLEIMQGDKVVELKSPDYTKGTEVLRLLKKDAYDFILAMGDDVTDEDMFRALPAGAVGVKINHISEYASYNIPSQKYVGPFLKMLAGKKFSGLL